MGQEPTVACTPRCCGRLDWLPCYAQTSYTYVMDLRSIRQKIIDSAPDDWNKIICWGPGSGPTFRYGLSSERGDNGIQTEAKGHAVIAVLIEDVDISIGWGYDPDETLWSETRPPFDFSNFLPDFPDKRVSRMYADVFYRGSLVDRKLFVVADGGRHYVPIPRTVYPDKKSSRDLGAPEHHYTQWDLGFARILNGLDGTRLFDEEVLSEMNYVLDDDDKGAVY